MIDVVMAFLASKSNATSPSLQFCEYLNISICPASETDSVYVAVNIVLLWILWVAL